MPGRAQAGWLICGQWRVLRRPWSLTGAAAPRGGRWRRALASVAGWWRTWLVRGRCSWVVRAVLGKGRCIWVVRAVLGELLPGVGLEIQGLPGQNKTGADNHGLFCRQCLRVQNKMMSLCIICLQMNRLCEHRYCAYEVMTVHACWVFEGDFSQK